MVIVAGVVALVLFAGLVVFQVALAAGAPWGRAAYGGAHPGELPASYRVASALAAVVWTGLALAIARRAGIPVWAPVPDAWLGVVAWVVLGLAVVSVVLNAITRSRVERAIWLPVSLVLLLATGLVALS
jgi:hypothetical protein